MSRSLEGAQPIEQPGRPAETDMATLFGVNDPARQEQFRQDLAEIAEAERRADQLLDIRIGDAALDGAEVDAAQ